MPNKHDAVVCEVSEDKYVSRISSASDAMTYDSVADRVLDHLYLISDNCWKSVYSAETPRTSLRPVCQSIIPAVKEEYFFINK